MTLSRLLPFTVLITATVFGQDVVLHHEQLGQNSAVGYVAGDNCPVGMAVDRSGLFAKREVAGTPVPGPNPVVEQRLRLDLTNRNPARITGAQITIHGLSQKTRYLELSTAEADLAKQIPLSLDLKGNGQSSSVLWLTRFAAITRVDLNSVTYADGSAWHEPSPAACSVAPSPLVRVALER